MTERDIHLKIQRTKPQSWSVEVWDGDEWQAEVSTRGDLWNTLERAIPYIVSCCNGHHPAYLENQLQPKGDS